ncbi:MAG: carboxypeptidase regulatory-like domain-containing protein [Okeania sp. SIO2C2]|uniref:carboxypeptidase-like regulatory domain-containing protein n=1 Tax=Okeania sp. SIO2C2 TaxID=2607787 RepID=UPI0013BCAAF7|nr:carboxypeptidase-like regulatory domain-containing protein [Okeania sp. SIO2C2]NEP87380.1 carboxypeptidase regulatory-like domain-containing protein [Okeania sp. SIO2C2]
MKWQFAIPLIFLSSVSLQGKAIAHGVKIQHQITQAIKINATYDTGAPLPNASVTVYAPIEPNKVWLKGTTDEQGNFIFHPDSSLSGTWEIKVRQAGHGGLVSIPFQVDKSNNYHHHNVSKNHKYLANISNDYNPLQKGLMIGCTMWGFVGTTLFFWRFKTQYRPQEEH